MDAQLLSTLMSSFILEKYSVADINKFLHFLRKVLVSVYDFEIHIIIQGVDRGLIKVFNCSLKFLNLFEWQIGLYWDI